jgi:integrase
MGKKRLVRSLRTDNLRRAQGLRWPVVAELQAEIEAARGGGSRTSSRDVLEEALSWRDAIQKAPDADTQEIMRLALGDRIENWGGKPLPLDEETGRPILPPDAVAFVGVALGKSTPLDTYVERWLAGANYTERTKADCRTAIRGLEHWCAEAVRPAVVEAFNDKLAGEYRDLGLVAKGVPVGTANKKLTLLRRYWSWMEEAGHVEGRNPWDRKSLRKPKPHLIRPDAWNARERPFTDDEMKKLLGGAPDLDMADAMRIAALSGMRLEEIGQLKVGDCRGGTFSVTKAKTKAGIREVPIHRDLVAIVARRSRGKEDTAFLFPDFKDTGWDGNRTMALSKRFATYRRRVGVNDARNGARRSKVNFHSFRRWFATKCEEAGQPENVVARVMGHEKGLAITFGVYSRPELRALLTVCVEKVTLPGSETAKDEGASTAHELSTNHP